MAYDLSSSPPSLLRGSPSASARFSTISVVGGDIRVVGATRAPPGATVICRGGYESGECPFGRNIILNDDIGGARGGARNRAPPPLHERVCNARGNENRWNRVLCGCGKRMGGRAHVPRFLRHSLVALLQSFDGGMKSLFRQFLRDLKNCCRGLWLFFFLDRMEDNLFWYNFFGNLRNCCLGII